MQAGTNRLLVLVAGMKQGGGSSKAPPLGFGPPNSTERSLPTMIAPVFLESGVGVLCVLLRTETHPSGPKEEDKFLFLQPRGFPKPLPLLGAVVLGAWAKDLLTGELLRNLGKSHGLFSLAKAQEPGPCSSSLPPPTCVLLGTSYNLSEPAFAPVTLT